MNVLELLLLCFLPLSYGAFLIESFHKRQPMSDPRYSPWFRPGRPIASKFDDDFRSIDLSSESADSQHQI